MTLVRYDNAHEETKGHGHHTAGGVADTVEFPGMEARLVECWTSADEYWDAIDGGPDRPYEQNRPIPMTTLHITVGDRDHVREDALAFVQELRLTLARSTTIQPGSSLGATTTS